MNTYSYVILSLYAPSNKMSTLIYCISFLFADRLDIIELAVSDTSGRVKEIQKDLARVVRATGENWAEIVELKAVK